MALFKNKKLSERKKTSTKLENLDNILNNLGESVNTEAVYIDIDEIDNPNFHDRTYIDIEALEELKENIKQYGLIEPIVVRPKPDGRYERIVGYRRLQAVKKLYNETKDEKWKKIQAIVLDVDEDTAIAVMLSENIHREDLSDYDKVVSVLQLIEYKLGMSETDVKRFFNKLTNKQSGLVKEEITEEEIKTLKKLEELLEYFKIRNWKTFRKMLTLLDIPEFLKEIIRDKKIPYYMAIELKKLKSENLIKEIVNKIVEENLTFEEVKQLVKQYRKEETKDKVFPYQSLNKSLRQKWKKLPEDKKRQIDILMKKIEEILKETY
ncbi:ParB/RepB/Spo0J family partition protein [Hydrogenothermus marinus]|uniref:ParB family protein n=1 Tax=Hydrogenothermus marinus TaxID=133270 RepID=A0A3M0BUT4_9AQUI|nr:ParB/RepB/Spo0J family partition protein [Hydrogenothermus marinus]RMB00060.1 ParB family protein [Hydrogenothermus marinus]